MVEWLLVLVLFLWVAGGAGWINFYEEVEDAELTMAGRGITAVTWPLMAVIAAASQIRDVRKSAEPS